MLDRAHSPQAALIRWTECHALLMVAALVAVSSSLPLYASALIAGLSFLGLLLIGRSRWTPTGQFGPANVVTLLRLLATVVLLAVPYAGNTLILVVGAAFLSLDGVDGWMARKTGLASEFGDYFDKEVDAFFMLALCLLLYAAGRLGAWILLPGALRYGFVWYLKLAEPPQPKERATRSSKTIALVMLSALMFCFLPFEPSCEILAASATVALVYSFGLSIWRLYVPQ